MIIPAPGEASLLAKMEGRNTAAYAWMLWRAGQPHLPLAGVEPSLTILPMHSTRRSKAKLNQAIDRSEQLSLEMVRRYSATLPSRSNHQAWWSQQTLWPQAPLVATASTKGGPHAEYGRPA
jgi:hypothetical protein